MKKREKIGLKNSTKPGSKDKNRSSSAARIGKTEKKGIDTIKELISTKTEAIERDRTQTQTTISIKKSQRSQLKLLNLSIKRRRYQNI